MRQRDLLTAKEWVSAANERLKTRAYIPDIVHGYLGMEKRMGVTRFIPILTKEDMAIYYHICGIVGDRLLKDVGNIYGGWRSIPTSANSGKYFGAKSLEGVAGEFQQNYYMSTFSNSAWFQQFKSFNEAIGKLVGEGNVGNYVMKTDIANFYDSIDVGRLLKKIRRDAPDLDQVVDLLDVFLSYWNRRTTGYMASSKGIPQEIISDGSRNLSHYYLQDFDNTFLRYCERHSLTYMRWADDILIFGSSPSALEAAIHNASRILLGDGLNLNANKTELFTRRDYERYRGLGVLNAVERRNQSDYQREVKAFINWSKRNPSRMDTVFRASIGYAATLGSKVSAFERDFLIGALRSNPNFIGGLNVKQILRLVSSADSSADMYDLIVRLAISKEITAPKANLLALLRESSHALVGLGVSKRKLVSSLERLKASSISSEILAQFCVPAAEASVNALP